MNPIVVLLGIALVVSPILAWTFLGSSSGGSKTADLMNGPATPTKKLKLGKGKKKSKGVDLVGRGSTDNGSAIDYRSALLAQSTKARALPVLQGLVKKVRRLTPAGWTEEMERRLAMAGMNTTWTAEKVLTIKAIGLVVGGALSFYFLTQGISSKINLIGFLGCGPLGFFITDILIKNTGDKRQEMIMRELPDILDQITVGVEAGLGFDSAMARSAKSNDGPLSEEIARTLQHVQAGLSRAEAMRGLANRNKVPELRQFVGAILQAEAFGIPMAQVLRVQATEQRRRRRQRAEEKAMKLPVKVLFPLIFCILPSLFIVIIGPAGLQIKDANFDGGSA
jgi:tight adherence protein C